MDDDYINSHSPKFTTPEKYVKDKLKILSRDFCIRPTETDLEHLKTLKTQTSIDNAIKSIIDHSWD